MSLTDKEANPEPIQMPDGSTVAPATHSIGPPSTWPVVQSFSGHVHDMQPDPSETEFEAERCTICGIGRLIRRKTEAEL